MTANPLTAAQLRASAGLVAIAADTTDFRDRFEALVADAKVMAAELAVLQERIARVAGALYRTAAAADIEPVDPLDGLPAEMRDTGFVDDWDAAGGRDPALAVFPERIEGGVALALKRAITQLAKCGIYTPSSGASSFVWRR